MPTTTPTISDQISAEKTKVSERLARLDTDRATVASQLTDLETAERVLMRVSKTPPARRTRSATAAAAKAPDASRGRRRTSRATACKAAGRDISAPSLGERILALATGRTLRQECAIWPRPDRCGSGRRAAIRASDDVFAADDRGVA